MNQEYYTRRDAAIKLLQATAKAVNQTIELAYSGGKDSDVILRLSQLASIDFRAIYKNTTIDPSHTIQHVRQSGAEIIQPKKTFLELVQLNGMPTRRARHCCRILKEYKILDVAIQGIRRCESDKRAKLYPSGDYTICRIYGSKKNHVSIILPILDWTDEQLEEFIQTEAIKCHPLYYRTDGSFDVSQRLGCLGCPLQGDNGRADFKKYPKLFKQVAKSAQIWWDSHPSAKSHEKFPSIYDLIAHNIYFKTYEDWYKATYTLWGKTDWKQFLKKDFHVSL